MFLLFMMAAHVLSVNLFAQRSTSMESHKIVKAMEKAHQGQVTFTLQMELKVCNGTTLNITVQGFVSSGLVSVVRK